MNWAGLLIIPSVWNVVLTTNKHFSINSSIRDGLSISRRRKNLHWWSSPWESLSLRAGQAPESWEKCSDVLCSCGSSSPSAEPRRCRPSRRKKETEPKTPNIITLTEYFIIRINKYFYKLHEYNAVNRIDYMDNPWIDDNKKVTLFLSTDRNCSCIFSIRCSGILKAHIHFAKN